MVIDTTSFILGAVFSGALVVIMGRVYSILWESRKMRSMSRRLKDYQKRLEKKNKLIAQAIKELDAGSPAREREFNWRKGA